MTETVAPPDAAPDASPDATGTYNPEGVEDVARRLARRQTVATTGRYARGLVRPPALVLRSAFRGLPDAYRTLADAAGTDVLLPPAADWILDNFGEIRAQGQRVREDLPWTFYRELPIVDRGPARGLPRVYEIMSRLVDTLDNAVEEEDIARFVGAFQETAPLSLGELWALPSMLRLVLLDRMGGLARQSVAEVEARQRAQAWALRIATQAENDPTDLVALLSDLVAAEAPLDSAFSAALSVALRRRGPAVGGVLRWLEERLERRGRTLAEASQLEGRRQAHLQASVTGAVMTLRRTAEIDWSGLVEGLSAVEAVLQRDPAGVYPAMDFPTRNRYRGRVEVLTRNARSGKDTAGLAGPAQVAIAERALALAEAATLTGDGSPPPDGHPGVDSHVGTYLVGPRSRLLERAVDARPTIAEGLRRAARRRPGVAYGIVYVTLALLLMSGAWLLAGGEGASRGLVALGLAVALLPALELTQALTNFFFTRALPPAPLPKLAFEDGMPTECRTLVVVPTLIGSPADARRQVAQLEVQALANPDPQIFFALLTDVPDAPEAVMPDDAETVQAAQEALRELNDRHRWAAPGAGRWGDQTRPSGHADRFFLMHRGRRWNEAQGIWMGWERKRGKLEEFTRLLREPDAETTYEVFEGDWRSVTEGDAIRYVVTLDADTQLAPRAATDLVRTAAHPLNRPVYDPAKRRVTQGYGVLQPRVGIRSGVGRRTLFASLFAGQTGSDPYTLAVSDVYQDLFGVGIFTGKGLYDVDAFHAALDGVLPENTVLSHDLLEGTHVRTALVTDVIVFDDFPSHYTAFAKRIHRWVRGDWQLVPWLFGRVPAPEGTRRNPVPGLGRWMLLDNLRRPLIPAVLLVFSLLAWTILPGPALLWTLLVVGVVAFPIYAPLTSAVLSHPRDAVWTSYLSGVFVDVRQQAQRTALAVAFLAHEAYLMVDAIVRTLARMARGKNLLEWVTASQAEARGGDAPGIWFSPLWAAIVTVTVLLVNPGALPLAAPFVLAWAAAPWLARWSGRPAADEAPPLDAVALERLRLIARRTWRYFDDFLDEDNRFLIPDNFQEAPFRGLARRTSPTNIGLGLLAVQTAVDMGFLGRGEALARLEGAFDTLDAMERHQGHFYNWYSTETAAPLLPRYVSTVDSGNLVGSLLTLKEGLREWATQPAATQASDAVLRDGLLATLDALAEVFEQPRRDPESTRPTRDAAAALREALAPPPPAEPDAVPAWLSALADLARALHEASEAAVFRNERDRAELTYWGAQPYLRLLSEQSDRGLGDADVPASRGAFDPARALALAARAERFAMGHDFRPLYERRAGAFVVGMDADSGQRDVHLYSLLASEARLASLLAVGRGDAPPEHWFRLGRPAATVGGERVVLSWSGTMFEYLMPLLFTRTFEGSLLDEACRSAVAVQRSYAKRRGIPWGISESAYFGLDLHLTYQYRAFGSPGLGLKRGLADDLVVAPYASALALMLHPAASLRNLDRLRDLGAWGPYGYYDAVDFTKKRLPPGEDHAVVGTYMAHHQGMVLLAIQNALQDDLVRERFHRDALVRAVEPLLQERAPREIERVPLPDDLAGIEMDDVQPAGLATTAGASRRLGGDPLGILAPDGVLLGGPHYSALATSAGAGYGRARTDHGDVAATRWRPDRTREADGTFVYVRDVDSGDVWSTTRMPVPEAVPDWYEVWAHAGRLETIRMDHGIEIKTETAVSPEDPVEVHRTTVTNRSDRTRHIELTSYAEVAIAPLQADLAHPAFSKLFVRTEALPEHNALLASRRPRKPSDPAPWLFHVLADERPEASEGANEWETDRARFLGRGRTPSSPAALDGPLSGTVGAVLDPIVSLRRVLRLAPRESASITFSTGIADSRDEAETLADRYDHPAATARALELADTFALVELQQLGLTGYEGALAHHLAVALLYGAPGYRAPESVLLRNRRPQSGLWAYGISGDRPILVFRANELDCVAAFRALVGMHALWRARGLEVDLVVLNEHPPTYADELQHALTQEIAASPGHGLVDQAGGFFVRRSDALPAEDVALLLTAARVVLDGALPDSPAEAPAPERPAPRLEPASVSIGGEPGTAPTGVSTDRDADLQFANGYGGFTDDGSEYVIRLPTADGVLATPLPWTNVVANEGFGFIATERGGGYAWALNSQQNKLTPWSNDPVLDPVGLGLYVRDEETGASFSLPPRDGTPYEVRHGHGYTVYRCERDGLDVEAVVFVPREDPVRVARVTLRDTAGRDRAVAVYQLATWALGEHRRVGQLFTRVAADPDTGALFATNPYNGTFGRLLAFADVAPLAQGVDEGPPEGVTFTADRTAFIGRGGTAEAPHAIRTGGPLDGRSGAGMDPCAAFRVALRVPAHGETAAVALVGQVATSESARDLIRAYREPQTLQGALDTIRAFWNDTLGALQVTTPVPALDTLVNGWLVYQNLACRLWGRSAFYQSGGAFGFRDQIQDACALTFTRPDLLRRQIALHAAHQFPEGDVLHWWHQETGSGVRTRISDDLLWLPFALDHYVESTGDASAMDEQAPFIQARELVPGEHEVYLTPDTTEETVPLAEHAFRAIDRSLTRGHHGLPLMGTGDWNDGMNAVGEEGHGESVWLGFFLAYLLDRWIPRAEALGETDRAARYRTYRTDLHAALNGPGWDGAWYRRAFYDDGTPLGSSTSDECRIDAIAQGWSIISGVAPPDKAAAALASAQEYLVDREAGIIRLLTPPFDATPRNPGYIKGYLPGVRENGGQYTHGTLWLVRAFAEAGHGDTAAALLEMITPVRRTATRAGADTFQTEPYAVAADVYGTEPHVGRGGWTWYTGSAGWMYRVAVESILGLTVERGDRLRIDPRIPADWPGFSVRWRLPAAPETGAPDGTVLEIEVTNGGAGQGVATVTLDGVPLDVENASAVVPLVRDGQTHHVAVHLGA